MSAAEDKESEEIIRSTFPILTEWQTRGAKAYKPPTGSELAADDADWPGFPLSTVAWSGLGSATDHLVAIQRHVEAKQLFPMSHPTLCRSALVGAAQAVWVLAPDGCPVRLSRTRTVLAEMYKRHLQYLTGLQDLADSPHAGTDIVAGVVKQRMGELEAKRSADNQKEKLEATKMIREAGESAFGKSNLVKEVVLAWQSGSGAAHGLSWQLFGVPGTSQTSSGASDGIAEFQAGGSLSRIANAYMAAFRLAEHGWNLFDKRSAIA
ncbi:hypothetical protein MPNTM1_02527 [Mycolicibacterium parafortuitum]|uniref:hypothetical protein n=1 Tax=Mycolicibacterium parafortuitum TaxID=39692 RepID=UPI0032C41376